MHLTTSQILFLQIPRAHRGAIPCIALSPCHRYIVTSGNDDQLVKVRLPLSPITAIKEV